MLGGVFRWRDPHCGNPNHVMSDLPGASTGKVQLDPSLPLTRRIEAQTFIKAEARFGSGSFYGQMKQKILGFCYFNISTIQQGCQANTNLYGLSIIIFKTLKTH